MSLNTSHTPDGRGLLLYNGEIILIYSKEVALEFDGLHPVFEGRKNGQLYLTSHRVIFTNNDIDDGLLSFSIPFQALREVKMRHPEIGATYLKGQVLAQPNGNWIGDTTFKLTFYAGSCIEFGEALLKAAKLATQHLHALYAPPPPYAPPLGNYFSAPSASFTGQDYGLHIPINAFPDQPDDGTVYMYEAPPPYAGIPPPIHQLPNELLVKIIDKLPRTQWTDLELVDHKFQDAVLLAWGSIREVDIVRDFIYSELKVIEDSDHESDEDDSVMVEEKLRRQIARRTEAILKKLYGRSPLITSLSGLSLMADDSTLNTTAVQYLTKLERLETIEFARKHFSVQIVNGRVLHFWCGIPLVNFIEFIESSQSRATMKEINIVQFGIPSDPIMVAIFDRLRAAVANVPARQLLQLESFSIRMIDGNYPFTLLDNIDASKLTQLSFGLSNIDPAVLTNLINGAPQLRHLDFAFLDSCNRYPNTTVCQGGRQQPNKELLAAMASHQQLTSLGFQRIWTCWKDCACHRFEAEFKNMLRTIGPRLVKFVFEPSFLPPGIPMGEIRDVIQTHMPSLKSIKLDKSWGWDPEELRGIADGKELEEIEIMSHKLSRNNYARVLNEVLLTIINKSPRLKRFNCIDYYPDQRVAAELCKLSDLIDLRIRAYGLANECFVAFSQQVFAEKLQVLRLGGIREGVESGLIELIRKAPRLRELMVERNVTDRLLECLAESCPNLEKFHDYLTDGITFDGVQMLVDRCPKLRWLYVENTDRTFSSSLKNLKLARYRKLEL